MKTLRSLAIILVVLMVAGPLPAANYTWTNTVAGGSGYWTNGVLWNSVVTSYPGSAAGDAAYLTNQFAGTYTNILDFTFGRTITTLALSNSLGEAWLVVTNAVLTNATFSLGSGGRLQIDSGGVFSNTTTFNWVGTNGVIYLNQGGNLITARAAGIAIGSGSGGVTALVSSVSGVGNGGVWEMTTKGLTVGNSTDGNVLRIADGAVVTNAGSITMSGNRNSLLVTDGGELNGAGAITFGTANYGNTVTLESGFWNLNAPNPGLGVGFGANSSNNTLNIVGATVTNILNGVYVGGNNFAAVGGANFNSLIVTNGGRLVVDGGYFLIGAALSGANPFNVGGGNNTVILSNSVIRGVSLPAIGVGSSNNILTLLGDTVWDNRAQGIRIGDRGLTYNNVMTVSGAGALFTNVGTIFIGGQTTGTTISNRLIISNGGIVSNVTGLQIGAISGAHYNSLIVTNGGRFFMTTGNFSVGNAANTAAGGGHNTAILSNSSVTVTAGSTPAIGAGSSNNTVRLLANTVFNGSGSALQMGGANTAGVGNELTVDGALLTNLTALAVGNGAGNLNYGNTVIVTNGGQLRTTSVGIAITVGQNGSSNNHFLVDGGPQPSASSTVVSNASNYFSSTLIGSSGSSFNKLTINNATYVGGGLVVGQGGAGNPATRSNQVVVSHGGILILNNSLIVGNGAVNAGSGGADYNSLVVTNGGRLFLNAGSIWLGAWGTFTGGGDNSVILSNSLLTSTTPTYIGSGSSNNTLTILADTAWDNRVQGIILGHRTASVANELNVQGGLLTNAGLLTVGNANGASSNRIVVSAGGVISNVTGVRIGITGGANYNQLIVTNGGRLVMATAGNFSVGSALNTTVGGGANTVVLSNSVLLINGSPCVGCGSSNNTVTLLADTVLDGGNTAFLIGNGAATGNRLTLDGGLFTNVSSVTVGTAAGASGNTLIVTNGGELRATTVQAGSTANNNSIQVNAGGVLQANTLTIGAATTGNTISNVGGTYQFVIAPTINSLTPGDIALTDGTISFRATSAANVTNTAANHLSRIRFAGANTFMLNNASNTAVAVRQTYTFDAIPGNPSNYVNLVMVNGPTAYSNGNGANVTIGTGGSLLVSNSIATFGGLVTNAGTARFVDSSAAFNGNLHVSGTNRLASSTVQLAGLTGTATGVFTNESGTSAVVFNTGNTTYAGTFRGPGLGLTINGGTLTLTGTSSHGAGTTISNGTLVLGANQALPTAGAVQISGGTLSLGGNNQTVGAVTVTTGTLTNGTLTGSSFNKTTAGTGTLAHGGTYQGSAALNSGTLVLNGTLAGLVTVNGGATLRGNGTIAGAVTVNNNGTLAPGNSLGALHLDALALQANSRLEFEFGGGNNDQILVATADGLTLHGGVFRLLTLGGDPFDTAGFYDLIGYTGNIAGSGVSALTVGNAINTRTYTFAENNGFVSLTIGGTGVGWNPGTLSTDANWNNAQNWNAGNGPAPAAFDQLLFDGFTKTSNTNDFTAGTRFGRLVFTNSAGSFVLNGTAPGANAVNLVGDIVNLSANTQTINLPLVLEGGSRNVNAANGAVVLAGVIGETGGALGLVKTGPRLVTLTGTNTYTGETEIQSGALRATQGMGLPTASNLKFNGGVLETAGTLLRATGTVAGAVQWTGSGGFSAVGGSLTVNLSSAAALTWGAGSFVPNGSTLIFGSSSADSDVTFLNPINFNGAARTVSVAGQTAELGGVLANGGLTKSGSGKLILSANNTYTGDTVVNAGTLVVNGRIASGGAFVLNGGTTLSGTGVIARTLSGSGVVAPGNSPGILTVGQVDPTGAMAFNFEFPSLNLTNFSSFNDVLRITNATPFTANLTAANVVHLYLQTPLVAGVTNRFRGGFYTDAGGNFNAQLTNANFIVHGPASLLYVTTVASSAFSPGGYVMEFGVLSQSLVSVIPEPNVLVLLLSGFATLWVSRRKRNRPQRSNVIRA